MSHSFDTVLAQPQRTVLLDAAVTLLSRLKRSNGGYLADVRAFGGVTRTYTDEDGIEMLQKAMGAAPSIAVALGTREFHTAALGGRQALSELQLLLYFSNQHGRDGLTGRHKIDSVGLADDTADPGLHVMMEHAIELMHGQYPTQTVGTLKQIEIRREEELGSSGAVTIWLQTYSIRLQTYTGSREFRTPEQLITSLHWRVTNDLDEVNRPDPPNSPTSLDTDSDPEP